MQNTLSYNFIIFYREMYICTLHLF